MRRPRLRARAGRHQPDGRRLLRRRRRSAGREPPLRRGNFMARMRMTVLYDRSVTWRRPRRRDRQQDRVAHRLHDAVRRQRLRLQPDRRPVQEPGPPAVGRPSACPTRSSARRPRPTCGRARPTRPRSASPTRRSTGSCSGWSTSGARSTRWSRMGFDRGDGRAGRPDGRGRRVQAPGAADRQARAADGGRRLPLPAAAAGLGAVTTPVTRRPTRSTAGARRHAVRRRHADRQPRRRHAPGARGAARGAADRRRGHAAHPRGCWTATGSRRALTSYHAQSGAGARREPARAPARRRRTWRS